jgi:hypothetical protein
MRIVGYLLVFLLPLVTFPASAAIPSEHAVALWLFDEGEGKTIKDLSGNGNEGEFKGEPEWVDGKFGKALKFDGADDYIVVPDSDSLDVNGDQITIVAWIKGSGWPAANHIVRKLHDQAQGHIYVLRVQPETIRVYIATDIKPSPGYQVDGTTPLNTDKWYHVALVYDGGEIRIYLNGELDGSLTASGNIETSDAELRIGRGDPAGYFAGVIDEVAIFNVALDEEEIKEIMENGLKTSLKVDPVGRLTTMWGEIKR